MRKCTSKFEPIFFPCCETMSSSIRARMFFVFYLLSLCKPQMKLILLKEYMSIYVSSVYIKTRERPRGGQEGPWPPNLLQRNNLAFKLVLKKYFKFFVFFFTLISKKLSMLFGLSKIKFLIPSLLIKPMSN